MLGWKTKFSNTSSLLSELAGEEADLIDHNIQEPAVQQEQRLTWDGRKGQWIPVSFAYSFPSHAFDHVVEATGGSIEVRRLAKHRFPPSKRHSVMLDQGSPRLRILPKAILDGRRPCTLKRPPRSPLVSRMSKAGDEIAETDDEEVAYEPANPFNLVDHHHHHRTIKPMSWLDDIDIEEFLSSAIDYQADNHLNNCAIPMSEPVYPFFTKRRRSSPCTPSSPPPPLFLDGNGPIPDFNPSPTHC